MGVAAAAPLAEPAAHPTTALLQGRYQALGTLIDQRRFEGLREQLRGVGDVERILARVALRSARPRDLAQLRSSLAVLPALRAALAEPRLPAAARTCTTVPRRTRTSSRCCRRAIAAEPATLLRDGDVIAAGYDAELDELRADRHPHR